MALQLGNEDMQAIFTLPHHSGRFEGGLLTYAQRISRKPRVLPLAFAPKVAGTFFCHAAIYAIGGRLVRAPYAMGGRDGSFYLPTMLAAFRDQTTPPVVMHIHMQAFNSNRHFVEAFNLKPIIMLRSIPDALASFWDMMIRSELLRSEGFQALIPPNFLAMTKGEKADYIIDMFAPWYASYFASWKAFHNDAPDRICVLDYAEFSQRPVPSLHRAVNHAGFNVSLVQCVEAVKRVRDSKADVRFNKGIAGRGREYFSTEHIARIAAMVDYYPDLEPWRDVLMGEADYTFRLTEHRHLP